MSSLQVKLHHKQSHERTCKKHTIIWMKCDYCHEIFDTIYNKKQHERGAHGEGWKAPCGE